MLRQYELDRSLAIIETLALPNVGRTQAAWKRFRRLLRMKAQRDAQRNLMAKWKGMMQLVSNVLLLLRPLLINIAHLCQAYVGSVVAAAIRVAGRSGHDPAEVEGLGEGRAEE